MEIEHAKGWFDAPRCLPLIRLLSRARHTRLDAIWRSVAGSAGRLSKDQDPDRLDRHLGDRSRENVPAPGLESGRVLIELLGDVVLIKALAAKGFYDGLSFSA